jgi:electron transfer flavoprotein beta subunit
MAAKKKEMKKVAAPAVAAGGPRVTSLYFPEKGKQTQIVPGAPPEAAKELVRRLREEARTL